MLLNKRITVTLLVVSMVTIAKCFYIRDELMEPVDTAAAENVNIGNSFYQQRDIRGVLSQGSRISPVGVLPRDQTVIVVPNSGTTAYRNVPYPTYGTSRGTSVIVNQGQGYSNIPRSVEILPVNPVVM